MRFLKYALVLTIGVSGCNSFNTYDQTARHQGQRERIEQQKKKKEDKGLFSFLFGSDDSSTEQPEPPPVPAVPTRDENGKFLCPVEKFAPVPNMPALPTEQLKQLGPNDKDAIIQLLTNHIDALRQYGKKVQDQQNAQHRRYTYDCRKWLLQHQQ
jgi:hypothetical protein